MRPAFLSEMRLKRQRRLQGGPTAASKTSRSRVAPGRKPTSSDLHAQTVSEKVVRHPDLSPTGPSTRKRSALPLVAEIKRNSLDDGPGIRSVVFFKGCRLRCVWCHNPECIHPGQEVLYRAQTCIRCGSCVKVCRSEAIGAGGPAEMDRARCDLCGLCAEECPTGAITLVGRAYTPRALADLLTLDKAFYDNSGGGVTLSGGEPTLFLDYTAALARILKMRGIRVLIETCGDFEWSRFESHLLPDIDQVFVDLKILDNSLHLHYAGRSNGRIKDNIRRLVRLPTPKTLVRIPLIPEITTTRENLEAISRWLRRAGVTRIALLPYNPLWIGKAKGLGRSLRYARDQWMPREERDQIKKIFQGFEFERDI